MKYGEKVVQDAQRGSFLQPYSLRIQRKTRTDEPLPRYDPSAVQNLTLVVGKVVPNAVKNVSDFIRQRVLRVVEPHHHFLQNEVSFKACQRILLSQDVLSKPDST